MTEREKWQSKGGQVIDKTNNSNLNQTQRMTKKKKRNISKINR